MAHILHTTHILTLGDQHRLSLLAECLHVDVEGCLAVNRHLRAEHLCQFVTVVGLQSTFLRVFLLDETVDDICVDTCEAALLQFLFEHRHHRHVELAVHQQHAVALVLSGLDIRVLVVLVGGIEVYEVTVLVGLVVLDERLVLLHSEVLAVDILKQGEILGTVVEVLLREHSVVDEELQIVPLSLVVLAVVFERLLQAIGDLLCDVGRDLLHVGVALQIAAADVQWNIR